MIDTKPQMQETQRMSQMQQVREYQDVLISTPVLFKHQKTKDRENLEKSQRGKIHLTYRGRRIRLQWISCQKPCKQEVSEVKFLKH